ncbi:MAG: AAA-like domain-containing protein [Caldilineales bacterium]|nr:AAA-like domain-containing protein [Caldilineales bacterium]
MRFFNTEGPVNCTRHYCLPPLQRFDLNDVLQLIEQQKYFLLHAPRQTGKTSCLLALAAYLNQEGRYRAVYANIEVAQAYRENVDKGMATVVEQISRSARDQIGDAGATTLAREVLATSTGGTSVEEFLTRWCEKAPLPTVLLLDEVDALVGDTLIALLRQLRAGYPKRPDLFPQTVILCGVRDLQDYRIQSSNEKTAITGGSAFNIKAKSLRLGDFSREETGALLWEHTQETGQVFTREALDAVWELTAGQPWLVNALAYTACFDSKAGRDRSQPITEEQILAAKEQLIVDRVTHIDQLADKLKEPRVRRTLEAILGGDQQADTIPTDDITYVRDLGLIKTEGQLAIANRIYQEVIPRELTFSAQLTIAQQPAWYIDANGRLDLPKLLTAFQQFFRENSEIWLERFDYKEAGPQLLMQAFLQRIINGGGRVEREYGLGRGRTDLLVIWPVGGGQPPVQRAVIELKVLRRSLAATLAEGLAQTWEYADRGGADEAHLVVFDRRPDRDWDERIWVQSAQHNDQTITVWGM